MAAWSLAWASFPSIDPMSKTGFAACDESYATKATQSSLSEQISYDYCEVTLCTIDKLSDSFIYAEYFRSTLSLYVSVLRDSNVTQYIRMHTYSQKIKENSPRFVFMVGKFT